MIVQLKNINNVFDKLFFIYNTFNTGASIIEITVYKNIIVYITFLSLLLLLLLFVFS